VVEMRLFILDFVKTLLLPHVLLRSSNHFEDTSTHSHHPMHAGKSFVSLYATTRQVLHCSAGAISAASVVQVLPYVSNTSFRGVA
jgi:hypothetical protein